LCNLYCAMSDQTNIESYELEETALINNSESENAKLYIGKVFENWDEIIRRRTYICQHERSYNSNSKKDTNLLFNFLFFAYLNTNLEHFKED
ncbi:16999_t:CDS:2, partial [Gigaspora margarita]